MSDTARRGGRVLLWTLAAYVGLVATHRGEFWPFSIYPMFSIAGQPWTRALVRDVAAVPNARRWQTVDFADLPGGCVVLPDLGVDPIDFANFVAKSRAWDAQRVSGLRSLFGEGRLTQRQWMVYKVRGELAAGRHVRVEAIPFLLLTGDDTHRNPSLSDADYGTQTAHAACLVAPVARP